MASSTLVPKKSLASRASPAGRPHRPTEPRVALSSQIDATKVLIERLFAAYERDDSQQLFDHVAVLQGSAFPVVSEWCQKFVDYASLIPLQCTLLLSLRPLRHA
jgi:hypothetical protein